jgi:RNA polymerase sigma factor FliA
MRATNALESDVAGGDLGDRASVRTKTQTRLRAVPDADATKAETLRELWEAYKTTGAVWARDRLLLEYAPYTKRVAERVGRRLAANVDQSDLVSWGIIGLIDALDKFTPDRGIKFESYATTRIQGAIIDALRSYDWTPRAVRRNARAVYDAQSRLEHQLRRTPTRAEVASELMLSEPSVSRMIAEAGASRLEPLAGQVTPDSGGERGVESRAYADPASNPEEVFEQEESDRLLVHAIGSLPDRQRLIVVLSYYERVSLADIGSALGITESRVCQLRTKALEQLRRRLAAQNPDRCPGLSASSSSGGS